MWTYSPKINRIFRVPPSMMNQSWMGSDFSNKDISKSTDIIDQYDHRLISTETRDDHLVYTIESIPHEEAAVVWGREILVIRDDYLMLRQEFRDQDDVLVKEMNTTEITLMDGRYIASRMRMHKLETEQEWTEMSVDAIDFDVVRRAAHGLAQPVAARAPHLAHGRRNDLLQQLVGVFDFAAVRQLRHDDR